MSARSSTSSRSRRAARAWASASPTSPAPPTPTWKPPTRRPPRTAPAPPSSSTYLDQAQSLFGDPTSSSSFFGQLDGVFSAFSTLASTPSTTAQAAAVGQVTQFLNSAQSISGSLTQLSSEADNQNHRRRGHGQRPAVADQQAEQLHLPGHRFRPGRHGRAEPAERADRPALRADERHGDADDHGRRDGEDLRRHGAGRRPGLGHAELRRLRRHGPDQPDARGWRLDPGPRRAAEQRRARWSGRPAQQPVAVHLRPARQPDEPDRGDPEPGVQQLFQRARALHPHRAQHRDGPGHRRLQLHRQDHGGRGQQFGRHAGQRGDRLFRRDDDQRQRNERELHALHLPVGR